MDVASQVGFRQKKKKIPKKIFFQIYLSEYVQTKKELKN